MSGTPPRLTSYDFPSDFLLSLSSVLNLLPAVFLYVSFVVFQCIITKEEERIYIEGEKYRSGLDLQYEYEG